MEAFNASEAADDALSSFGAAFEELGGAAAGVAGDLLASSLEEEVDPPAAGDVALGVGGWEADAESVDPLPPSSCWDIATAGNRRRRPRNIDLIYLIILKPVAEH